MAQEKMITKKKKVKFKYFCDCPICMVMKKADGEGRSLGYEELTEAFAKAREKQTTK
jgi:hypothetical protein